MIRNYFNEETVIINNNRYIDSTKAHGNVRLLSMNPHGCRPFNSSKMHMLKQSIRRMNIDIILMNETNMKWTSTYISKIEKEMKEIDRVPIVLTSDSKEQETTSSDYLPGRVMNVILSKCSPIFQQNNVTKGRLGNWLAFSL